MRLRLRIERNALPPTQALWPVKDTKSTIAQLLQQVNDTFPLESDTWGLEDYSVSVSGYECLHYHELRAVCKDEDEVLIKALQYVDVRARALVGRDQIAADGRHLVDGIPFGRPLLRAPVRPEVRIPPRKKRRLLHGTANDEQAEEGAAPLMLMEHEEELEDDEDDEDDEDFGVEESEDDASSDSSSDSSSSDSSADSSSGSSPSDSSSDDKSSGEGNSSSNSDSSASDDTSDDDSEDGWNGIPASAPPTPKKKQATGSNVKVNDKTEVQSTGSKRKRQSDDQDHEAVESHETEVKGTPSLPYEGSKDTKNRNDRRRDAKKLKYLKETQVLSPDATMRDLHEWRNNDAEGVSAVAKVDGNSSTEATGAAVEPNVSVADAVQRETTSTETLDHEPPPTGSKSKIRNQNADKAVGPEESESLEQKREQLMSQIAAGGVDVTQQPKLTKREKKEEKKRSRAMDELTMDDVDNEPPQELSSKQHVVEKQNQPAYQWTGIEDGTAVDAEVAADTEQGVGTTGQEAVTAMIPPTVARRSRLDLAGSQRLLYGSLGVRVPKTQEDKDRIQKKLAERPRRNVILTEQDAPGQDASGVLPIEAGNTNVVAPEPEDGEVSEAWRENVIVTAVECCDEDVTLSTPPFPFYQRWDANFKKKKAGKRINGTYMETSGKKRKRGKQNPEFVESYDKYNQDGYGDALNYDEEDGEDEYWEDGALLDEDYDEEEADGAEESDKVADGFPELPANMSSLPALTQDEAQIGDFVAFNELACDTSTKWQPTMKTRIAQLVSKPEDGHCVLQSSARDIKRKIFDDEGNRVYSKFEMPSEDGEDDVEDDGRREVVWTELGDVRLVSRPSNEGEVNEA